MNVNIIGNKVFVNGSLLPPVPGAKSSVSLSQAGNRLYVNGYEYRNGRMLFPEDVANVIQSFYLCNKGDEATTDLLLAVGAELLDISPDKMLEMITEGF